MRKLYLLPLLFLLCLASCKDEQDIPVPQPEPEAPVPDEPKQEPEAREVPFTFSFTPSRYSYDSEVATEFELIVSQKDGKVLLDTLVAAGKNHGLSVRSEEDKFDVTTVYLDPATLNYVMRTYIQVNPDNWRVNQSGLRAIQGKEPARIHYTNIPTGASTDYSLTTQVKFSGKNPTGYATDWDYRGNLSVGYARSLPTDTAYLLLTDLGKYIFAEITPGEPRVDFSGAKTAVKHQFDIPAGVAQPYSFLVGHFKKGKYNQHMTLYFGSGGEDYHLQYPTTVIEEFNLNVTYSDVAGNSHGYYHIGESIPTDLGFLSEADFTVTKPEFNDFQIQFVEDKPTSYYMSWNSEELKVDWRIYLSPEEATLKLKDYLQGLNVGYLEGLDLSGFSLRDVLTYKADGYTHQSLHDYLNDPDAMQRYELKQYRTIYKKIK